MLGELADAVSFDAFWKQNSRKDYRHAKNSPEKTKAGDRRKKEPSRTEQNRARTEQNRAEPSRTEQEPSKNRAEPSKNRARTEQEPSRTEQIRAAAQEQARIKCDFFIENIQKKTKFLQNADQNPKLDKIRDTSTEIPLIPLLEVWEELSGRTNVQSSCQTVKIMIKRVWPSQPDFSLAYTLAGIFASETSNFGRRSVGID